MRARVEDLAPIAVHDILSCPLSDSQDSSKCNFHCHETLQRAVHPLRNDIAMLHWLLFG